MRQIVTRMLIGMALLLWSAPCPGQARYHSIDSDARQQIDAGNQLWVDAMKQGNVALLGPGNADDAVDCGAGGDCIRGREALEKHMREEMAKSGKADSASVISVGSVQQGRYVYEWGEARGPLPQWAHHRGPVPDCLAEATGRQVEALPKLGDAEQLISGETTSSPYCVSPANQKMPVQRLTPLIPAGMLQS